MFNPEIRNTRFAASTKKFLATCGLLLMTGCGGYDVHGLSGSVTYEGEPVATGRLVFIPDEEAGNKGPRTEALIENGRYQTPEKSGVVGGKYIVEVDGFQYDQATGGDQPEQVRLFPLQQLKVDLPTSEGTYDIQLSASR